MDNLSERKMNDKANSLVKSLPLVAVAAVVLTVGLYLICYYYLPPPPPSAGGVSVLALISLMVVSVVRFLYLRIRGRKKPHA
jgi:hypothetical protein